MNRRGSMVAWVAFGPPGPGPGPGPRAGQIGRRGEVGLPVRRQDPGRLDHRRRHARDLEGRGRRDPRLGAGLAPVQPPGRLQELQVPRRGQDRRQGQLRACTSGPRRKRGFPNGYEAQVNSTHGDPVKTGSLYNHVKVFDQLVPPDTWFTQEIEAVGNHIIIKVNGKTTVDYDRQEELASRPATSPSSSTTPAARSGSGRSRSWNCPRRPSPRSKTHPGSFQPDARCSMIDGNPDRGHCPIRSSFISDWAWIFGNPDDRMAALRAIDRHPWRQHH